VPDEPLSDAQERRIDLIARRLALRPGQRLLHIGCGRGQLMLHAAEHYGVECLGVTLSMQDARHVREQAEARRLPIKVRVASYLHLDERAGWERVISLGLLGRPPHVADARLVAKVRALLVPGGLCLLHCVGGAPPGNDPLARQGAFPGWWLGSLERVAARAAACRLDVLEIRDLRHDYALTARAWRRSLRERPGEIAPGQKAARRWEFHLASLAAQLRAGQLRPFEVLMARRTQGEDLLAREDLLPPPPARPRSNGQPILAETAMI
jgi:cyclopropane-fatty-acyl-phospholipid synthase